MSKLPRQAGTYLGDDHKQYFSGDSALKAGGKENTMNQFDTKVREEDIREAMIMMMSRKPLMMMMMKRQLMMKMILMIAR